MLAVCPFMYARVSFIPCETPSPTSVGSDPIDGGKHRGRDGAIKTTAIGSSPQMDAAFLATLQNHGIGVLHDAYGGDVRRCFASSHLGYLTRQTR